MAKALGSATFILLISLSAQGATARVMSFNILLGGAEHYPLNVTAEVIRRARADVVGLQETDSNGAELSRRLGYYWHPVAKGTRPGGIASRYPITKTFRQGAEITLPGGEKMVVFSVHLMSSPYEPYDIRDRKIRTEVAAIRSAQATRGAEIAEVLTEMVPVMASGTPVFLVGDFNEPSHLDWTELAGPRGARLHRMKVRWPTSVAVLQAGLRDAYRTVFPSEVRRRGYTWTPFFSWREVHDRIDFIYFAGNRVGVTQVQIVGERDGKDVDLIGHPKYPSDHRAVVAQFVW